MKRSPLAIAREYLDSGAGPAARNACALLGQLGGADAAAELVRVALGHESDALRRRAEDELARLTPTQGPHIEGALERALADPEQRRAAYLLLGRLHQRGAPLQAGPRGFLGRLRLLLELEPLEPRPLYLGDAFRSIGMGMGAGTALFILVVLLGAGGIGSATSFAYGTLFWVPVVIFLGSCATRRSTGLQLHAYRAAASACELLRMVRSLLMPLIAVPVLLIGIRASGSISTDADLHLLETLGVGLWLLAVRSGTLLGFGLSPTPLLGHAAQIALGSCIGMLLGAALLRLELRSYAEAEFVGTLWSMAVPGAVGLSAWFAERERGGAPAPAQAAGWQRLAAAALLALTALGAAHHVHSMLAWASEWPLQAEPGWWAIRSEQAAFQVQLAPGQRLRASVPGESKEQKRDFKLVLAEGGQRRSADDPPALESAALRESSPCLVVHETAQNDKPEGCLPGMSWDWVFATVTMPSTPLRVDDSTESLPEANFYVYIEPPAAQASAAPQPAPAQDELVRVPAGLAWIGCNGALTTCDPAGELRRVAGFSIERTEVTAEQYQRCVAAGSCSAALVPEGADGARCTAGGSGEAGRHPIGCVSGEQAEQYCRWQGRRLPRADEWERAMRGGDGRRYPWGSGPAVRRGNAAAAPAQGSEADDGFAASAPVGSFPEGASPFGVLDGFGNVREITAGEAGYSVLGSDWSMTSAESDLWTRTRLEAASPTIGFRCAQDG